MHRSRRGALVWHRTDGRLDDNAAVLEAAALSAGRACGVVCLPDEPSRAILPGVPWRSARRVRFELEGVAALRAEWEARGSTLLVTRGEPHTVLPRLAARLGIDAVVTAPCLAHDEAREDMRVAEALRTLDVTLVRRDETTLLAPEDLPFALDALPRVFSDFRRAVERPLVVRPPVPAPVELAPPDGAREVAAEQTVPSLADFGLEVPLEDPRRAWPCRGGRAEGLARLRRWIWDEDALARYKETRDGLMGAGFSSKLSPWLASGALSPREVVLEVRRYERERVANESTYWLIFELLWRDYFHFWVRRWGARAFAKRGVLGRTPCGAPDSATFERWRRGETGEPFVDAGMRELAATGYLSNRLRQNVASWLARTANVDWRWGAAWFESQLVDYDVGPNWGNWQYVAGVGNDPRNRTFDVRAQAEHYDPDGAYRRLWAEP